jgi:hypothetical protein
MRSRLNNHNLPPVPPWDEIIERTERDMAAQNFLNRHGLWMMIQARGAGWCGIVKAFASGSWVRGQRLHGAPAARPQKQCSISLPGKKPIPRDVLAAMSKQATMGNPFTRRRLSAFFTEEELAEMKRVL